MTAATAPSTAAHAERGHVGLVVLASIGAGLAFGLLLVLRVFAGGSEPQIVGSALVGLGTGFALLAFTSTRRTNQPQRWALVPSIGTTVAGLGMLAFAPGERLLDLAGWVWPVLLAILVVSSFRGARRSVDNWSRRALVNPALVVLSLIAVAGGVGTVMAAGSPNPVPTSGRTYLANGHRLYLNCVGSGSPIVVLFSGLGEWT